MPCHRELSSDDVYPVQAENLMTHANRNDHPIGKPADAEDGTETTTPASADDVRDATPQNPPRTTTGWFTAPKFGSAGSGGAELDPGPERD
jgi:hypothetical protein